MPYIPVAAFLHSRGVLCRVAEFFHCRGVLCSIFEWRRFFIAGVVSDIYPSGGVFS